MVRVGRDVETKQSTSQIISRAMVGLSALQECHEELMMLKMKGEVSEWMGG